MLGLHLHRLSLGFKNGLTRRHIGELHYLEEFLGTVETYAVNHNRRPSKVGEDAPGGIHLTEGRCLVSQIIFDGVILRIVLLYEFADMHGYSSILSP